MIHGMWGTRLKTIGGHDLPSFFPTGPAAGYGRIAQPDRYNDDVPDDRIGDWREYVSDTGEVYFFSGTLNSSNYIRPSCMPVEWIIHTSHEEGAYFYQSLRDN